MKKLLAHFLIAAIALIVVVGTFWPDGLDWLFPSSMRYELWPVWAKILGWLCVVSVTVANFIPTNPGTSKH